MILTMTRMSRKSTDISSLGHDPVIQLSRLPRLWTDRTKEVRTSGDRVDPGGYRRLAAIEGWVYTRPVKRKTMTFYFVYLKTTISVPDTSKCS